MSLGFNCKVVFLGDTCVGKSCLTMRFVRGKYCEFQEPTIGAAFLAKSMNYKGKHIKLEIWDTAGQERYRSLAPMYYRDAKAAVIVYDITQTDTLKGAKTWIEELYRKRDDCVIILVGNKLDLAKNRTVDANNVKEYVRIHNIIYMEASAKSGHNVEEIFNKICEEVSESSEELGNTIIRPEPLIKSKITNNCC